jgi:tetratricopeptide (TPR) repeat protein
MSRSVFLLRGCSLLAVCLVVSGAGHGQAGVLGRRAQGKIQFEPVEELLINGSHKIRLVPSNSSPLPLSEFKHLAKMEVHAVGFLRLQADGHIARRDFEGGNPEVVASEDLSPSNPVTVSALPTRLRITAVRSKKQKQTTEIAPEEFLCFIPGPQADHAVFSILFEANAFDSTEERLSAIQGFVASFPDSVLKNELRLKLERIVRDGLVEFDGGGSFAKLLVTERFATTAHFALPGQGAVEDLFRDAEAKVTFVRKAVATLGALAAAEDWDSFLSSYLKFEPYQSSFPDLIRLRHVAWEESARVHAQLARSLAARSDHGAAVKEIAFAVRLDPENQESVRFLDSEKMLESEAEARERAAKLTPLIKDSPQDRQFRRSLFISERAIADKDVPKAEAAIRDAEAISPGSPEVLLTKALLLEKSGRFAEALAMLDEHDRSVVDIAERDKGETLRDELLYDLGKRRVSLRQQLTQLFTAGEYTQLKAQADDALNLDPNDEQFLFFDALSHMVLRDPGSGKSLLQHYLERSDSLNGNPKWRELALRLASVNEERAAAPASGALNWMSGRSVRPGVFYCPESAAFQPVIDGISGYKMHMAFQWQGSHLQSITSSFEDDKAAANYTALNPAHAASKGQMPGSFYFLYAPKFEQVQTVTVTKPDQQSTFSAVRVATSKDGAALVDELGRPRIVLRDHPQVNVAVADLINGNISTVVAGNSFFNPLVWDGVHFFSAEYDSNGHLIGASERDADNIVRFSWDGDRLTGVKAFHRDSKTPYYERTIVYSSDGIEGETYSANGKSGKIKYIYSGGVLQQAKLEDNGVHDGKTWVARIRP